MTTQRKGIFAETTAKAYLLKNENVLTILKFNVTMLNMKVSVKELRQDNHIE